MLYNNLDNISKYTNCICNAKDYNPIHKYIKCFACNNYQHFDCVFPYTDIKQNKITKYMCPMCIDKYINPYQMVIKNVIKSKLLSSSQINIEFENNLNEGEYLRLSCIHFQNNYYNIHFPSNLDIKLNNKSIFIINETIRKKSRPIYFFTNESLYNIKKKKYTNYFLINSLNSNSISNNLLSINISEKEFAKNIFNDSNYYFTLSIIKDLDDTTKNSINKENEISSLKNIITQVNYMKNILLYTNLENDYKDFCEADINIKNPISINTSIKTPIRGYLCHHLNIFDLDDYLEYSKLTDIVLCPICMNILGYVYIDGILLKIIKNTVKNENIIKVDFKTKLIKTVNHTYSFDPNCTNKSFINLYYIDKYLLGKPSTNKYNNYNSSSEVIVLESDNNDINNKHNVLDVIDLTDDNGNFLKKKRSRLTNKHKKIRDRNKINNKLNDNNSCSSQNEIDTNSTSNNENNRIQALKKNIIININKCLISSKKGNINNGKTIEKKNGYGLGK